jgi:oligoribonuclease NrnB/cAMP/cGMP phosphodiesterase (DHH superfamily)
MRIITRPDFDGIVCAALLFETENITHGIKWVEPRQIQTGSVEILNGDIIANLPYDSNCSLWFDHHVSNSPGVKISGSFAIAPSAAGVVYNYYREKNRINKNFDELILNTDMIDSADLTEEQVLHPEDYPYILLSMTIKNNDFKDIEYWNRLVEKLRHDSIETILEDPDIKSRCEDVVKANLAFETYLKEYTTVSNQISVTDFRPIEKVPSGNRFTIYSLFPESIASVKIRYMQNDKKFVLLSVGHSIFNQNCHVNVGNLLSKFGGGGHQGAGGCTLDTDTADQAIEHILNTLYEN